MKMAALGAAALALLAAQSAMARGVTQNVTLVLDAAGACHMRFAGKDVVVAKAGSSAGLGLDSKRPVHLVADMSLPYRCVGGVIYLLQADGFSDIGFTSAPPRP